MTNRIPSWLCVCALLLVAAWSAAGCAEEEGNGGFGGSGGFSDATSAALTHKSFRFGPDAGLFGEEESRYGQSATLIVGEFKPSGSPALHQHYIQTGFERPLEGAVEGSAVGPRHTGSELNLGRHTV
jgi:hypothetical protein